MTEEDKRLQPVTYGSVIYLSIESSLGCFMFSDGFMDNRVTLKGFEGISGHAKSHHDFSFCLFMVLPFANLGQFDNQRNTIQWRSNLLNKQTNQNDDSQDLEARRNNITDLKNKLESELQFNTGTIQKSKGSNICFGSSNFMLLHVNSLKYLSLLQDDNSNLFLILTESPDKNSFFNFDPSLKLQKGRSDNFVYENEIVHLSCTEQNSGKNPYLCIKTDGDGFDLESKEQLIIGAIDDKENWKVNIYEEPLEDSLSQNMRIGASIWLLLSEKPLYLIADRDKDPFQELYEYQYLDGQKNYQSKVKQDENKSKDQGDQQQQKDTKLASPQSRLEFLCSQEKKNLTEGFFEDPREHLYDKSRMSVGLSEIKEQSNKVGETDELSSFGLWKIESMDVTRGGELRWQDRYRLKHLITGQYLSENNTSDQLFLSNKNDEYTEFQFVPKNNLIQYQSKLQTKGTIQKDAFFMIQCYKSGNWIGFFEKSEAEQDDRINRIPALIKYVKDVNTFRFREANFSSVWENYSLISSYPMLFKITKSTMNTSKETQEMILKKETIDKQYMMFDLCYQKTLNILNFFVDFLMNRILSNINLEQEIMYPSDVRQNKFSQQFLLGFLCWMLIEIFPTLEEFEKMQISPDEESLKFLNSNQLIRNSKSSLKKKNGAKQIKNISKISQEHLLKKYNICRSAYKVLQAACYQNQENQDFVFKFIKRLSDHVGFGEFTSESFQIIFKDNSKILHSIHREQYFLQDDQGKLMTQYQNIFQVITGRLKLFEPYKKIEILKLLGGLTHIGKSSIYINQDKIFTSIVENKSFLFGHLLKLICEREYLFKIINRTFIYVEYREFVQKEFQLRLQEMVQFFKIPDQQLIEYFKVQMRLYALLCQNRNYACVKNMTELLPQKVLLAYLSNNNQNQNNNEKLTDEFQAIICLMMLNLYVDKEPRTIINKPNFVRVFRPPRKEQNILQNTINLIPFEKINPLKFLQKTTNNRVRALEDDEIQIPLSSESKAKDDDITARFIEINLSDDITGTYEIREWLLSYLETRTGYIIDFQKDKNASDNQNKVSDLIEKVFNQLTYEVIRTLSIMVKFGLLTKYATKLMENAQNQKQKYNISKREGVDTNTKIQFDAENDKPGKKNHLERLTQLLAYLLEFDHDYFYELQKHDVKRKYLEFLNQKKFGEDLLGAGTGLVNLFVSKKLKEEDLVTKEEYQQSKSQHKSDEHQPDQYLTSYQSLLKVIQKFSNKTYTNQEFDINNKENYQVMIKKEICLIFENLLEWRSDYYMENTIQFFQNKFYPQYMAQAEAAEKHYDRESLKELMPDLFLNPGQSVHKKEKLHKKHIHKHEGVQDQQIRDREEVRDLDLVLGRPLVEILLLAFYFSQESSLSNSIVNLIFKIYSQRELLIKNIQKVSLVDAESGNQSYSKLSQKMTKFKGLISYSQSWLQIVEQNDYDEKSEEILIRTQNNLRKMLKIFEEKNPNNSEAFIVKQKVFKRLSGHKIMLRFIEQGFTVIDSKVEYFQEDLVNAFSYKKQFIQNVKNTFVLSHQILSIFAEDSLTNQIQLHKHYGKILVNAVNINIGQVEFIQDMFRHNQKLSSESQVIYFNFIVNLIKDHGHHYQFIKVFSVFLETAREHQDNVFIQKQILKTLFHDDNVAAVNPLILNDSENSKRHLQFYPDPPNEILYINEYIQCVCECIRVDVGINYLIKVNQNLSVYTLMKLLVKETQVKETQQSSSSKLKANVCEILHIFFDKLDVAIEQFRVDAQEFILLLKLQMDKLTQQDHLNQDEQQFLGQNILGLVNTYFEHFLKDTGMIALKMLSKDKEVLKENKIFEFAQVINNNLDKFFVQDQIGLHNMAKLIKNFNLPINQKFLLLKETFELNEIHLISQSSNKELENILYGEQDTRKHLDKNIFHIAQRKIQIVADLVKVSRILPKIIQKKPQSNQIFAQSWTSFVNMLTKSQNIKTLIKKERMAFPDVILQVSDMFQENQGASDTRQREMLLSSDDIIVKLLQYIQYWKARGANRNTIIFVLKSIRSLVSVKKNQTKIEKVQQQNHLDKLNATQIALRLYWKDKQTQDQYVYQLIKFIIQLLDGGNKTIQMSILTLFKTNPDSEAFFRKIFNILTNEMNTIKINAKRINTEQDLVQQKIQRKFIEKTLRFIQLLCEGHNNYLQNYLRQQTNSKVSYDLVSLIIKLVIAHKISDKTYPSVLQCLETLIEAVQGPCKDNQMVIITSKFLEWSIDLLREDEKLFDIRVQKIHDQPEIDSPQKALIQGQDAERSKFKKTDSGQNYQQLIVSDEKLNIESQNQIILEKAHLNQGRDVIAINRGNLMRLKHKCTVMLLSLLEMQENNEEIVNRLIRGIPCSILADQIARVHAIYKIEFGKDYTKEAFNRRGDDIDCTMPLDPKDELVIEYGFNLFILVNILMTQNKKSQESELAEIQQLIEDFQFVKESDEDDLINGLSKLGDLSSIGQSIFAKSLGALKSLTGSEQQKAQSELAQEKERRKVQKNAFEFFSRNTAFIEVVRDQELIRIYFPLMPHCRNLPQDTKQQFHENLDHSSTRDKLTHLMKEADFIIEVLNHEEDLRRIFKTSKLLEFIANHKSLWENLAFIANIVLNLTILASYSQYSYTDDTPVADQTPSEIQYARLYEPRFLLNYQYDFTDKIIKFMGVVTLVFSSLVIFFFFLKRAPLLLKNMWIKFSQFKGHWLSKTLLFVQTIVRSIISMCTDFEFVYYSFFMTFLVLGLLVHPFIFVFLLVDFLRISTLKIVVKSIWISKGAMSLIFLVFLLVEYYFTIISYVFLYDQYIPGMCNTMWECFLVTFDQTFKNGGAIGEYLVDPERVIVAKDVFPLGQLPISYERPAEEQERFVERVMYDDSFKFILRFIIINMVAGIIIDTFKALKEAMLETERNLTEYCFICGIEREKLDKSTPHGYHSHIKKDHYMWNYLYYKAYLKEKPQTEFSGNESYIQNQLANNDIDWFPVKRAMGVTDEDEGDDNQVKLELIEEINMELPELESIANQVMQKIKNIFEKN